ncbi:hypothetical protein [Chryseobacterium wangxinyae]|uniref:hypothetical protein n=1 Tax=Chryseobacterium sp. CY353 TaxID=2997334 RepID=UPI00226D564C|nr:hypothetical protein [Chryseobacterium sp. CY353]MCY0971101.1 hypothetical protein [Chryseobacterium sp. CY353]
MMKYASLRKSNIVLLLLSSLLSKAQYKIIARTDLNIDNTKDIVYKDSVTNKFIFEYGKSNGKKNDSIFFFSNYNSEAGSVNLKIIKNTTINIKFIYAPKYLDYDLLSFTYDKLKKDWFLSNLLSYRTNPLSERLITEKCLYKVPKKLSLSLKKNNFDDIQEKLIDNKKYLVKCSKSNLE